MKMEPYFKSARMQKKLKDEAERWIGTPFMPYQGMRQGGCDCVHLVSELIGACGFQHEFKPPIYTLDATNHHDDSMLHDYLDHMPGCECVEGDNIMVGDFVTFVVGRAPHHLAIMIKPPVFIHSMRGLGTTWGQLNDPTWGKRLDRVYRLFES